jgi:hypothetical protein
MMEKSSRFISLSGWSGIAAGVCGLGGAFFAWRTLESYSSGSAPDEATRVVLSWTLLLTAGVVFSCAFITAFLFTYLRSKREGVPIWGQSAKRLLWNTLLPMAAGAAVILRLIETENYSLIAPCTLIFYGLALINGSKYTVGEIRYMGYLEIVLGISNLWFPDQWLVFWAAGFGILHIIYGIVMWWKYERKSA